MCEVTQSFAHFVWAVKDRRKDLALIMMGHTELVDDDLWNEYIEWCKTDEGKSYLKGGKNYKEEDE